MDYDREMLSTIKDMVTSMEDLVDTFEDMTEHLEDIKDQFKGMGESGKSAGDGMATLGNQIKTVGDIGSSAFGGIEKLIKSITGESNKTTSAISGMFSLVNATGATLSFAPSLSNTQSDIEKIRTANTAYISALNETGKIAGLKLADISSTDRIIDELDKLSSKTSLTVIEQQTYNGLIDSLTRKMPEMLNFLDEQNEKYKIKWDFLKKLNGEDVEKVLDKAVSDAEEASSKNVEDLKAAYDGIQTSNESKLTNLRNDIQEVPTIKASNFIKADVAQQIREKNNMKPYEQLSLEQINIVGKADALFRSSNDFYKFLDDPFWGEYGLSSENLEYLYTNGEQSTFDSALKERDLSGEMFGQISEQIIEIGDVIALAGDAYMTAKKDHESEKYIQQGLNSALQYAQIKGREDGYDSVQISSAMEKGIYKYGYYVDDFFYVHEITPDFYEGKSGADILSLEMDSSEMMGLAELANIVFSLQTIKDYIGNNASVSQQSINNAMLNVKEYLPENVDIDQPTLLTDENINSMLNQYLMEHPETMEALLDDIQNVKELLDQDKWEDWLNDATNPIYQMCQKQPTVTLELAIGTLKTLGVVEEKNSALGWTYFGGGRTWVGEHGPEILDLPPGSKIYSHSTSKNMMHNSVGGIVTNNTFYVREESDIEKVAEVLAQKLKRAAVS